VFQLKQAVGTDAIRSREDSFIRRAIESWCANPNIDVLGNHDAERLSIVSLVVKFGERHLHHNYVVALLNDLFGIQSRGGCSCAGPYGHRLLGIDLDTSHEFAREVARGCEGIKPGWVRVNFNYFISEVAFSYILEAVHLIAEHGWKLLPQYRFDPASGLWKHHDQPSEPPMSLKSISYEYGSMAYPAHRDHQPESALAGYLEEAKKMLESAAPRIDPRAGDLELTGDFEHLRWFPLPGEARTR